MKQNKNVLIFILTDHKMNKISIRNCYTKNRINSLKCTKFTNGARKSTRYDLKTLKNSF